jgi:hypothetical protein
MSRLQRDTSVHSYGVVATHCKPRSNTLATGPMQKSHGLHAPQFVPCPRGNSPAGPPPAPHTLESAQRVLMIDLSSIASFLQKSISSTLSNLP